MGRSKEELLLDQVKKIGKGYEKWKHQIKAFLDDVPYGTPLVYKDKKVLEVLFGLLDHLSLRGTSSDVMLVVETLRRIFPVKGIYKNLHKIELGPLLKVLTSDNATACQESLAVVLYILEQPSHINKATNGERPETGIKNRFFQAQGPKVLVDVLYKWAYTDEDDIIHYALSIIHSLVITHQHTTDFDSLQHMLTLFNTLQSQLFDLSRHHQPRIRFLAMAIVRALLLENDSKTATHVQNYAREHGLLLWHLNYAINGDEGSSAPFANPRRLSVGFPSPPSNIPGRPDATPLPPAGGPLPVIQEDEAAPISPPPPEAPVSAPAVEAGGGDGDGDGDGDSSDESDIADDGGSDLDHDDDDDDDDDDDGSSDSGSDIPPPPSYDPPSDHGSDNDDDDSDSAIPPPPAHDPPDASDERSSSPIPPPPSHEPGDKIRSEHKTVPPPPAHEPGEKRGITVEVQPASTTPTTITTTTAAAAPATGSRVAAVKDAGALPSVRVFSSFSEKPAFEPTSKGRMRSQTRGGRKAISMLPSRSKTHPCFKISSLSSVHKDNTIKAKNSKCRDDQRRLSRDLVGLLVDRNPLSLSLIQRIFPSALCAKLDEPAAPKPTEIPHFPSKLNKKQQQVFALKSKHIVNCYNWKAFFTAFDKDHNSRSLIWHSGLRDEIRKKLALEIADLDIERVVVNKVTMWDHAGFVVSLDGFKAYPRAGPYFTVPLLQELSQENPRVSQPRKMYRILYKTSVIEDDPERKLLVLKCMTLLLERKFSALKDKVSLPYTLWRLRHCESDTIRDELLDFLKVILKDIGAVKAFTAHGGIAIVIDFLCLSHQVLPGPKPVPKHPSALAQRCLRILDLVTTDPRSAKILARGDVFQRVAQLLLLRTDSEVTGATMTLITNVTKAVPAIHSSLHQTGIFAFLLILCAKVCTEEMATFFANYHRKQDYVGHGIEEGKDDSYLRLFLPEPVFSLLDQDPKLFSDAMNGTSNRPDLKWNEQLRLHLADCLTEQIQDFLPQLQRDHMALYIYTPFEPISYPTLEVELCVDGIYVEEFNCDSASYPVDDPDALLGSFMKATAGYQTSDSEPIIALLRAQENLFRRFPSKKSFLNYAGFETVLKLLQLPLSEHAYIVSSAARLLDAILSPQDTAKSIHIRSASQGPRNTNVSGFLGKGGLGIVASILESIVSGHGDFDASLVSYLFKIIEHIVIHSDSAEHLSKHPEIARNVIHFFLPSERAYNQDAALMAVNALPALCRSSVKQQQLVDLGAPFHLLDIILSEYVDMETLEESPSLPLAAARGLDALVQGSHRGKELLTTLLTPGVCTLVNQPVELVRTLRHGSTSTPQILWTSSMLQEFTEWLKKKVGSPPPLACDVAGLQYSELSDIVTVHGVYLPLFNDSPETELGDRAFYSQFMNELVSSIASEFDQCDVSISCTKLLSLYNILRAHDHLVSEVSMTTDAVMKWLQLLAQTSSRVVRQRILDILLLVSRIPTTAEAVSEYMSLLHHLVHLTPESERPPVDTVLGVLVNVFQLHPTPLVVRDTGLLATLAYLVTSSQETTVRLQAARGLGILTKYLQPHYEEIRAVMFSIFGPGHEQSMSDACERPEGFLQDYDRDHWTPRTIWDQSMRHSVRAFMATEVEPVQEHLRAHHTPTSASYVWDHAGIPSRFTPASLANNVRVGEFFIEPLLQTEDYYELQGYHAGLEFLPLLFERMRSDFAALTDSTRAKKQYSLLCQCLKHVLVGCPELYTSNDVTAHTEFLLSNFVDRVPSEDQAILAELVFKIAGVDVPGELNPFAAQMEVCHLQPLWFALLAKLPDTATVQILDLTRDMLSASHGFVQQTRASGGIITLMWAILSSADPEARERAAVCLQVIVTDEDHGSDLLEFVCDMLTPNFSELGTAPPEGIVKFFDLNHESETGAKWNASFRTQFTQALASEVSAMKDRSGPWDGTINVFTLKNIPRPQE